jgi:hypothetical protein
VDAGRALGGGNGASTHPTATPAAPARPPLRATPPPASHYLQGSNDDLSLNTIDDLSRSTQVRARISRIRAAQDSLSTDGPPVDHGPAAAPPVPPPVEMPSAAHLSRSRARLEPLPQSAAGGSSAPKPLPPIQSSVPIPPRAAIAPRAAAPPSASPSGSPEVKKGLLKKLVKEAPAAPATASEHARSLEAEAAEEIAAEHEAAEDEAASVLLDAAVERARRESLAEEAGTSAPPSPDRPPGSPRSPGRAIPAFSPSLAAEGRQLLASASTASLSAPVDEVFPELAHRLQLDLEDD